MASQRLSYFATAAVSGLLFGAGLYVSQMVDPLKVLRFLDFTAIPAGGWDPSLAFVIVPAILVMFIAVRIDLRLVGGAALFGLGWGMSGLCPGPAISLIAFPPDGLWYFLIALLAGSYAGSLIVPSGHAQRLADAK